MTSSDQLPSRIERSAQTLRELLIRRAADQSDDLAYAFLSDDLQIVSRLTYHELLVRAGALAREIAVRAGPGERVLLVYGPGLDSVIAFWACMLAGVVAVPTPSPDGAQIKNAVPRLRLIAADARASLTLTTTVTLAAVTALQVLSEAELDTWFAADTVQTSDATLAELPARRANDTAYLQYTSGSTAAPRGVIITHANVLANCAAITEHVPRVANPGVLSWLPYFHDYGLVHGIIWPLSRGMPGYLMSPLTFLRRPLRWLEAIAKHRLAYTGAPNFALAACVRELERKPGWYVDLTSLRHVSCGAEPINPHTVERFLQAFSPFELGAEAFTPAYGLAEATLAVTAKLPNTMPVQLVVDAAALAERRVQVAASAGESSRVLISCGTPMLATEVIVVDPETRRPLPENGIGEIWVAGPAVGAGYFGNTEATVASFNHALAGSDQAKFLRTGDLGFFHDGQLYITGRLKDLLIFRGRNYVPQDLEWTAEASDQRIRAGHSAAFAIDGADGEQLVLAFEVDRRVAASELPLIAATARRAIAHVHELPVQAIAVVRSGSVPRTSSGKIRRQQCRTDYLAGQLDTLWLDQLEAGEQRSSDAASVPSIQDIRALSDPAARQELLETTLRDVIARQLQRSADSIELGVSAIEAGLDSLAVVQVLQELESAWSIRLTLSHLLGSETLRLAAAAILARVEAAASAVGPIAAADSQGNERQTAGELMPLSPAQERLWFLAQIEGASRAYHLSGGIRLRGALNREALYRALDAIVARHEMLRTMFVTRAGAPMQRVIVAADRQFALREQAVGTEGLSAAQLTALLSEEAAAPFDLLRGPLVRGLLIAESSTQHVLWLSMHHIVADGWSIGVLINELAELYRAFAADQPDPLPVLPAQYRHYVAAQRRLSAAGDYAAHLDYWRSTLAGAPDCIELPADHRPIEEGEFAGAAVELNLEPRVYRDLREFARRHGVTPFMALLGVWVAVLSRVSGQDDLVVGTAVADRPGAEFRDLIGFCVNTLALRFTLPAAGTASELLALVKDQVLTAQAHAAVPFERVVDAVRVSRSRAHSPLFNVMFAWQDTGRSDWQLPGLQVERLPDAPVVAVTNDMTLVFEEAGDRLLGRLEYSTTLFSRPTVERLLQCWHAVFSAILRDPKQQIGALPLLDAGETGSVVAAPRLAVPTVGLHALFEARAREAGESIALHTDATEVSYAELERRANALAHRLRELGVGPEDRVALAGPRSIELVVGMLAVLKAGGAFVPLDPQYPAERLAWMLQDAEPKVLLKSAAVSAPWAESRAATAGMAIVELSAESIAADVARLGAEPMALARVSGESLAYMIYTSGSSGTPKGVLVEHRNVVNLVCAMQPLLQLTPADRLLHHSSISFDAAIWELFVPLASGASVVLVPPGAQGDPAAMLQTIEKHAATVMLFVPAFLRALLEHGEMRAQPSVRTVVSGGEALSPAHAQQLRRHWPQVQLINQYGPTECTVVSTWFDATRLSSDAATVPIGRPIGNTSIQVLDAARQPVPVGIVGELYVSGDAVARGYWRRPDLTDESFGDFQGPQNGRYYRTGDLVRLRADGELEFVGRMDQQIKVRGMRVELGEIEAALTALPGIRAACVVASADGTGNNSLLAYVVGSAESPAELREQLGETLPQHMVPTAFVQLEALPLLPNGKIDRHRLPAPAASAYVRHEFAAPEGPTEQQIAAIWRELLQVERVGRHDNFFELGGHSLLALALIERLRSHGIHGEPRQVFSAPTLVALARELQHSLPPVDVPANLIPANCERITPAMLPLVKLSQREVDSIAATVAGGARNVQDIYPLAPLQEGIFFHHLLSRAHDPYLSRLILQFDTEDALRRYWGAMRRVVARHDALRTAVVHATLHEPVQVVWREAAPSLDDFEVEPGVADPVERLRRLADQRFPSLPLHEAPLMRGIAAHHAATGGWYLLLLAHHLTSDHSTLETINAEIAALMVDPNAQLPASVPFRGLVAQARDATAREHHTEFFRSMLADIDESTAPYGLLEVRGDGTANVVSGGPIDAKLHERVREVARAAQVSTASILHLAFAASLSRLASRQDVVFGTVVLGRLSGVEDTGQVVGPSINTLPLRVSVGEQSVTRSLRAMHRSLTELMRHEQASLALAQRCSSLPAPAPLFTALLNYRHNLHGGTAHSAAPAGVRVCLAEERTNYPLAVVIDDDDTSLAITVDADASMDPEALWRMLCHTLEQLVDSLQREPDQAFDQLDVLPAREQQRALQLAQSAERLATPESALHELFAARAREAGESIALHTDATEVSYAELERRANALAHRLRELGVGPEDRVALAGPRSIELVVGMLAVLKAGGAFVPLDPQYPAERLAWMLQDAEPKVLLKSAAVSAPWAESRAATAGMAIVELSAESIAADVARLGAEPMALARVSGESLAYMIYTSGSSGTPKGVLVEHRNVVNLVCAMQPLLQLTPADRLLHHSSISFDAAIWELFVPLASGASVVLVPPGAQGDPAAMLQTIEKHAATVMLFVPAFLRALLEHGEMRAQPSVRVVASGAEALLPVHVQELREHWPQARVLNLYGPTECAVVSTWYDTARLSADAKSVPIGLPLANTATYILDERLRPAPVGVVGEICLGGASVARGYHNQSALSRARFVPDPFSAASNARLYRSGDLGRYLPDGSVEFLGRADTQVKLRGFRVELGEIEAQLKMRPNVRDACVAIKRNAAAGEVLVGYLVGDTIELQRVRDDLARTLPRHMVPAAWVVLPSLPLLPNGKIDRQKLPAPDEDAYPRGEYVPAEGEIEQRLAEIWCEVLQLERVGRHDNFFELGGHSLIATQVASRLRDRFGLEVPLRSLFENPSLMGFAAQIALAQSSNERVEAPAIEPVDRDAPLPVSFSQRRMWFMQQMEPEGTAYNIPAAVRLRGALDAGLLRRAVDDLAARHEAFRTTFAMVDGEPVQVIAPQHRGRIEPVDLTDLDQAAAEAEAVRLCRAESLRPFNLQTGPLWRINLIKLRPDDTVLLWSMHHAISDQWSVGVLARDLAYIYNQHLSRRPRSKSPATGDVPLEPLRIQYADFAAWQRQHWNDAQLQGQLDFWRQRLRGLEPIDLPTDKPRAAMPTSRGASVNAKLSAGTVQGLNRLSIQLGVTPFMTLLTCFKLLLSRYSGQDDIAVGVPIANRHRIETEVLVGTLVNMVVMRTDLNGELSFAQTARRVRETALEAYAHQDTSFERLVEALVDKRATSRAPLVQVMFNVPNAPLELPKLAGLATEPFRFDQGSSQFELSLTVDTELTQVASLAYSTDLFSAETAERMLAGYLRLLDQAIGDPRRSVRSFELLSAAERAQLIELGTRTPTDFPQRRVDELIAAQATRTPDAIAVRMGDQKLTYAQLNDRAEKLARVLASRGVGHSAVVGIHLERSPAMLVALLAVMKSGAAYLPLDPGFPLDRLEFMVADAGAALVVSEHALRRNRPADWPTLELETAARETGVAAGAQVAADMEDLAYILYTSGSTGQPKGIEIEHRSLTNFLHSMRAQPGCGAADVLLAVTTLSFDISGLELYLPLIVGGQVVLASRAEASDGNLLRRAIARCRPTIMQATPATWRMLLTAGWEGEPQMRVLCGGEALPSDLSSALLQRCAALWNMYGPTETTIWSTTARITQTMDVVPIGEPIANTSVHVLDSYLRPVPPGVAGELYIGGDGVARGYHNRPELTRERFVPDPFATDSAGRLYRTGDRARRLINGQLVHLGRLDFQVKVRGFRVELGEIEAALAQHPALLQVVVAAKTDREGAAQRLVAYAVPRSGAAPDAEELREFLHGRLPDYMVPSQFMLLESLPLTANKKVDIRALPEPTIERLSRPEGEAEEPSDMLQLQLLALWRQVLSDPQLGIDDNFFDAGGHSLKAVELLALVEQVFHKQLPLAMFFEAPTVAKMAQLVRASGWSPSWRSLVAIQPRGVKLPLFAVPGAGGNVLVFAALAKLLGNDRPLYGLQSRGLDGLSKPFTSIEEAAEHFLAEIRSVQPQGPYFILGTCTGGVVAYEIAQRLRRADAEVTLVIVESWHPSSNRRSVLGVDRFWRVRQLSDRLRQFARVLSQFPAGQWPRLVIGKVTQLARGNSQRELDSDVARSDRVRDATMQAVARYDALPYPGRVLNVIASQRKVDHATDDTRRAWETLAQGGASFEQIPAEDSGRLFVSPHVEVLARYVERFAAAELCEADAARRPPQRRGH